MRIPSKLTNPNFKRTAHCAKRKCEWRVFGQTQLHLLLGLPAKLLVAARRWLPRPLCGYPLHRPRCPGLRSLRVEPPAAQDPHCKHVPNCDFRIPRTGWRAI